jgi:hypothetical protein
VDEGIPDAGPAAAGRRRALDLVRGRRRPEDEPLRERVPAQPSRVRPRGTDAKPTAAKRRDGQGQQQQQLDAAAAMRCRRSRRSRGAHPGGLEISAARQFLQLKRVRLLHTQQGTGQSGRRRVISQSYVPWAVGHVTGNLFLPPA